MSEDSKITVLLTVGASRPVPVRIGDSCMEACDRHRLPVEFGCRGGACGTCVVRVLAGAENLSPLTEKEEILLADFEDEENVRLTCQLRIHGPVHLTPYEF